MAQGQEISPSQPGKLVVVLKSPRTEDKPTEVGRTDAMLMLQSTDPSIERSDEHISKHEEPISKHEDPTQTANRTEEHERGYRQGNWVHSEIIILLEAKCKEQELFPFSRRSSISADEKWKFVADYCHSKGIHRTKDQCRIKWDNLQPDYRRIKEYEEQREEGALSYYEIEVWERRQKMLPSNMDMDVYQRILSYHSKKARKGGVKRDVREKKANDATSSPGIIPNRIFGNGTMDGPNGGDPVSDKRHWGNSAPFDEYACKHGHVNSRKRRTLGKRKIESSSLPSSDDTSTEDDNTVISSRFRPATVAPAHLYGEKYTTSKTKVYNGRDMSRVIYEEAQNSLRAIDRSNADGRDMSRVIYREAQNGRQALERTNSDGRDVSRSIYQEAQNGHLAIERNNGNATTFPARIGMAGVASYGAGKYIKDYDNASYIQDRKDARHKEFLALEREKLAVFHEASLTISNAMTSTMAAFAKVAEEFLVRHR